MALTTVRSSGLIGVLSDGYISEHPDGNPSSCLCCTAQDNATVVLEKFLSIFQEQSTNSSGTTTGTNSICLLKLPSDPVFPTYRFPISMTQVGLCWRLTPGFSRSYTTGSGATVPGYIQGQIAVGSPSAWQWMSQYASMNVVISDSSVAQNGTRIRFAATFTADGSISPFPTSAACSSFNSSFGTRVTSTALSYWSFEVEWPVDQTGATATVTIRVYSNLPITPATNLPNPVGCNNYFPFQYTAPVTCPDSVPIRYLTDGITDHVFISPGVCMTATDARNAHIAFTSWSIALGNTSLNNSRLFIERPAGCCTQ